MRSGTGRRDGGRAAVRQGGAPDLRRRQLGAGALLGLGLVLLPGCGGASDAANQTSLRLLNASPGYPSLDLQVATVATNTAVAYGTAGAYAGVSTAGVSTVVLGTGSASALSTATRTLTEGVHYTLVAYGAVGALKTALIQEDVAAPASGLTSLNLQNLAPDAGAVDIYLTGSADDLASATAVTSGLASGSASGYLSTASGTYRLRVTGSGDKADLRLDVAGLVLGSAQVATLLLTQGAGGVLVNSVLLVQQGAATALSNASARVRLVAAVAGNAVVSATLAGSTLASAVVAPAIGSYTLVTASTQAPLTVTVNGVPMALANQAIGAGGDHTLLVWGDAAAPQCTLLVDDNRLPTVATRAKLRLLNGTTGTASALTLQADLFPIANAVAQGQASDYVGVSANSALALNIDTSTRFGWYSSASTGVNIAAMGLYTVFAFGDSAATTGQVQVRRER